MHDKPQASSPEVAHRMSIHPRRDTGPELAARRLLHAAGLRFRVIYKVPGAPRRTIDVAFTRLRIAVFLDGCFWHGCPEHGQLPASNQDWWKSKIERNRMRDADTTAILTADGWQVLRFWEHQTPEAVTETILAVVTARRRSNTPRLPGR
jgi:DNA mismatch endonuclease (patch repair protein)